MFSRFRSTLRDECPYLVEIRIPHLLRNNIVYIGRQLFFQDAIVSVDNTTNIMQRLFVVLIIEDIEMLVVKEVHQFKRLLFSRWFVVIGFSVIN